MKNKIGVLIALMVCIIIVSVAIIMNQNKDDFHTNNVQAVENIMQTNMENKNMNASIESGGEMNTILKVFINQKIYNATLEPNETAKQFLNMLPQEFSMKELNGNEKYVYLDTTFITDSYSPKHIEAGDIMLFGDNCLVVFYRSFDTSYRYTKIGHIENLENLGNQNITIKFEK